MKKLLLLCVMVFSLASLSFAGFYDRNPNMPHNRSWDLTMDIDSGPDIDVKFANNANLNTSLDSNVLGLVFQKYINKYIGIAVGISGGGGDKAIRDETNPLSGGRTESIYYNYDVTYNIFSIKAIGRYPVNRYIDIYGGLGFGSATIDVKQSSHEQITSSSGFTTYWRDMSQDQSFTETTPIIEAGAQFYLGHFVLGASAKYTSIEVTTASALYDSTTADSSGIAYGFKLGVAF